MMEHGMGMQFGIGGAFGALVYILLIVVPFWQLWRRTGHSGWIAVLMIVPVVNLVMLWVLAFKAWPIDPPRVRGAS